MENKNKMENKNLVSENLETAFSYLEKFLKTETVVGEPIIIGETTIIPLVTVSFGLGGGGGKGKDAKGVDGDGGGLGMGARIATDAVLVIKGDSVNLIPVKGRTDLDRLVTMVPELLGKFGKKKEDKENIKEAKEILNEEK